MLRDAQAQGARAAKIAFVGPYINKGVDLVKDKGLDFAKWMAVGHAPQVFTEGPRTFQPGGMMHWRNVLWPTLPNNPGRQMMGRAGTVLSLAALPGMMSRDKAQGEGHLASLLGGLGSLGGMMYGGAFGLMGSPVGAAAGHRLGLGLGHLLGSNPQSNYQ